MSERSRVKSFRMRILCYATYGNVSVIRKCFHRFPCHFEWNALEKQETFLCIGYEKDTYVCMVSKDTNPETFKSKVLVWCVKSAPELSKHL